MLSTKLETFDFSTSSWQTNEVNFCIFASAFYEFLRGASKGPSAGLYSWAGQQNWNALFSFLECKLNVLFLEGNHDIVPPENIHVKLMIVRNLLVNRLLTLQLLDHAC